MFTDDPVVNKTEQGSLVQSKDWVKVWATDVNP